MIDKYSLEQMLFYSAHIQLNFKKSFL